MEDVDPRRPGSYRLTCRPVLLAAVLMSMALIVIVGVRGTSDAVPRWITALARRARRIEDQVRYGGPVRASHRQ
jgi:hypothetical protein